MTKEMGDHDRLPSRGSAQHGRLTLLTTRLSKAGQWVVMALFLVALLWVFLRISVMYVPLRNPCCELCR